MSAKGKLSYDRQEPAFLRRLRGEVGGSGDGDRHERPTARPKRAKRDDDEDDGPTYVAENNDTLSKAEYEALVSSKPTDETTGEGQDATKGVDVDESGGLTTKGDGAAPRVKQQVQEIGKATKKRKAVKVGGEDEDEDEDEGKDSELRSKKNAPAKKAKKKAKAIKLSFGDDE